MPEVTKSDYLLRTIESGLDRASDISGFSLIFTAFFGAIVIVEALQFDRLLDVLATGVLLVVLFAWVNVLGAKRDMRLRLLKEWRWRTFTNREAIDSADYVALRKACEQLDRMTEKVGRDERFFEEQMRLFDETFGLAHRPKEPSGQ